MGVHLIGVYLMSVHLMGVYVMGAYLIRLRGARLCTRCTPVYVRCTSTRYMPPWVHIWELHVWEMHVCKVQLAREYV
jgi:hypothetical protein